MKRGVILYGPPAAGKDTIDAALRERSADYRHFARMKVGEGRTEGYRLGTAAEVEQLRARREIVWENSRYGATYVVDLPGLVEALDGGVPIIHLGQVEAVEAVRHAVPDARWLVVELWCPEEVTASRLARRGSLDVGERLRAWQETPRLDSADLRFDTSASLPGAVARAIHAWPNFGPTQSA